MFVGPFLAALLLSLTGTEVAAAGWYAVCAGVIGVGNGISSGILMTLEADLAPAGTEPLSWGRRVRAAYRAACRLIKWCALPAGCDELAGRELVAALAVGLCGDAADERAGVDLERRGDANQ